MKCRAARKLFVDLLDVAPDSAVRATVMAHLDVCPLCRKEFEELEQTLAAVTPGQRIRASAMLKETIMNRTIEVEAGRVSAQPDRRARRPWRVAAAIGVAAALLMLATYGIWLLQGEGAEHLTAFAVMGQAAHAVSALQSVHISAQMRTLPNDNFQVIVLDHEFIPIDLWRTFSTPPQWRVETEGRVVVMDGESATLWIKPANMAANLNNSTGAIGWLAPLLDVDSILESEQELAREEGSVLTLEHATGPDGAAELVVYVEATAQGDYTNDWLRNKSIGDADNLRVYRLDADSMLLKGLQVYVHADEGDVLVFETTDIEYNSDLDAALFALELPDDVSWLVEPVATKDDAYYASLAPEECARAFFEACGREDWEEVKKFYPVEPIPAQMKTLFGQLELLSLGTPFQSGRFPGWFVPYEIRLSDGRTKTFNLAVRNDTGAGRYVIDGGL